MAQIKSTMEMVLARAERLCAETTTDTNSEALQHGMRVGASFLQGDNVDLAAPISNYSPLEAAAFCQGLLRTFFRHVVLPREEGQPWEGALQGILALAKVTPTQTNEVGQLQGIIAEVRNILSRYMQHRQQLEKQLEENFAMQTAHLQQSLAQQTGMKMKFSPRQHPKFNEEWQRVQTQLNDQYLHALEQYKQAICSLLGLSL